MMGGLINGSMVKGDLWMVESGGGNLSCYSVATVSEGPGPRVGHASLLVGNAFIVFGGDTKMDDSDALDDTLYLLNTCRLFSAGLIRGADKDRSLQTMVSSDSRRSQTCRTIWTYLEHTGVEDLHLWRAGRRLFLQRPPGL